MFTFGKRQSQIEITINQKIQTEVERCKQFNQHPIQCRSEKCWYHYDTGKCDAHRSRISGKPPRQQRLRNSHKGQESRTTRGTSSKSNRSQRNSHRRRRRSRSTPPPTTPARPSARATPTAASRGGAGKSGTGTQRSPRSAIGASASTY